MLVEGAGSAAEVNLRANDIANMGFARAADVPVVLIGDIDRGGVIAQIVGTQAVLDPADAALIAGFHRQQVSRRPVAVRGRHAIHRPSAPAGRRSACPVFPAAARLPAEDAVALERGRPRGRGRDDRRSRCCRTSPISTISIR